MDIVNCGYEDIVEGNTHNGIVEEYIVELVFKDKESSSLDGFVKEG